MGQTLSRREQKKSETRQALVEAALALFREYGYSATTIKDITDRADVAKGTFFNYFASKEALLNDLSVWRVEKMRAALDVGQGAPSSPVARIKMLLRLSYDQVVEDVRLFRRALAARLIHPHPSLHQAKHHILPVLADLVGEAQACGEIRADADVVLVSDLLHIAFFWRMMVGCDESEVPPPVEEIESMVDLLLEGLAGPNWRTR